MAPPPARREESPAQAPAAPPAKETAQRPAGESPRQRPAGAPPAGTAPQPVAAEQPPAAAAPKPTTNGQLTAAELRRVWPNVLEEVKRRRRFTHMLLAQHAQVVEVSEGTLTLGFSGPGPRENFGAGGSIDVLADALIEVIGVELRIHPIVSGDAPADEVAHQRPSGAPVAAAERPEPRQEPVAPQARPEAEVSNDDEVLDATNNAEELLSNTFAAELIAVREAEER